MLGAIIVAALGFLPIANWLSGGHAAPWYANVASGWLSGTAIALGVGIVLAIFSRRIPVLWHDRGLDRVIVHWERRPVACCAAITALASALYVAVARIVFDGRPLHVDEISQLVEAHILAHGALWQPAFTHPEFFSSLLIADTHGRVYAQFPIGGPAMLAVGVLLHAPWMIDPLCGAIAVAAFAAFVRRTESDSGVALNATLLLSFAPFTLFMSGSHMNEPATLMWVMSAICALANVVTSEDARPALALVSGLAFGIAATIRPVDALAFALPAGVWYLTRAVREPRRWSDAFAAGIGVALPVLVLLWANDRTTGAPLRFGYEALWGPSHSLGFHTAPWGVSHTPAHGLELVNLYFLRLQTYLFETPTPSLLPAIGALALTRRLDRFDRYLLASSALLVGLYFCYWFDGFYLGPRFVYLLLIPLAIWTARFFPLVRARLGAALPYRATVYAALTAVLIAATALIPLRARQYRNELVTMRWNADSAAAASGVQHALVLVRESWGAQLVARLWALDVSRDETELLYPRVDACALDQAITSLEQSSMHGPTAFAALQSLLGDSTRLVRSPFSPDTSEAYLPGSRYIARCIARVNEDRAGFTLLTPLLLAHGGDNVYARDLHARDTLLLAAFPNRPLYLLRPASPALGAPPRFYPLSRDSLMRAWR